jgi:hypothetical protein
MILHGHCHSRRRWRPTCTDDPSEPIGHPQETPALRRRRTSTSRPPLRTTRTGVALRRHDRMRMGHRSRGYAKVRPPGRSASRRSSDLHCASHDAEKTEACAVIDLNALHAGPSRITVFGQSPELSSCTSLNLNPREAVVAPPGVEPVAYVIESLIILYGRWLGELDLIESPPKSMTRSWRWQGKFLSEAEERTDRGAAQGRQAAQRYPFHSGRHFLESASGGPAASARPYPAR